MDTQHKAAKSKKKQSMKVPMHALQFAAGQFEFGDNGEDAKTAPVHIVALSGKPLDHCWFGPTIQDLSVMKHKNRIAIDYLHDLNQIVGYINKFDISDNQLKLDGAMIPFKDNDRATEIIHKQREGIPYEASIYFPPSRPGELKIERLEEGETAEVNGQKVKGPMTIFRQWTLRGVAICPYGADAGTRTFIQSDADKEVQVEIIEKEEEIMGENLTDVERQAAEEEAARQESAAQAEKERVESLAKQSAAEQKQKELADKNRAEFKQFVEEFGDKAADYFAKGLTFVEASKAHTTHLKGEIVRLEKEKKETQAAKESGAEGVDFDGGGDEPKLNIKSPEWCQKFCEKAGGDPVALREKMKEDALKKQKRNK